MHLGNSILCPYTAIPAMAVAAGFYCYSLKGARKEFKKENLLKIISLTALVFVLQMVNFTIPQTGASGHIIGGVLLAALLGQNIAFLMMGLILFVQALFFADGGLGAIGCNLFNMGVISCFVAYPFIYKPLENKSPFLAVMLASIGALILGSASVSIEAFLSGTVLNFGAFLALKCSIHFFIALFEGAFSGIILYLSNKKHFYSLSLIVSFVLSAIATRIASNMPDGLEWSLINISDELYLKTQGVFYTVFESLQNKIAPAFLNENILNILGVVSVCVLAFLLIKLIAPKSTNA